MNQEKLQIIKETAEEFLKKIDSNVEIMISSEEDLISIKVETNEPHFLIGEGGQTLTEIQHLLRMVLRRKMTESFFLNLDINDYKEKKYKYLKEIALSVADEVVLTGKEKALAPMPAHERRVVHLALAERLDVFSESVGEKSNRKIVIRPKL